MDVAAAVCGRWKGNAMRVAVLSDIHGNLVALDAVLADLAAQGGADALAIAGDLCLDGPRPREVLDRVRGLDCAVVQGNTDRDLALPPGPAAKTDDADLLGWTRAQLGDEGIAYLGALPFSHRIVAPDGRSVLLIVHANPKNMDQHLPPLAPEGQIAPLLADLPPEVTTIAFGHLHLPYVRDVGRLRLIDISSVGLPKDGDRRAGYGLLTWTGDGWSCEQRRVEYPVEETIDQIRAAAPPNADELIRTLLRARYANMVEARGGKGAARRVSGPRVTAKANPATPPPVVPSFAAQEAPAPPRTRRVVARPQPVSLPTEALPPAAVPVDIPASAGPIPTPPRRARQASPPVQPGPPAATIPAVRAESAVAAEATRVPPPPVNVEPSPPPVAVSSAPDPHGEESGALSEAIAMSDHETASHDTPSAPSKKPGRKVRERALLQADAPFPALLPELLEGRLAAMLKHLASVRDEDDPDAVHALRVATRHLRVALDSAKPFFGKKEHKHLVREVRRLAEAAGKVRDTDVLLEYLRARALLETEAERAGIESLLDALSAERATVRDELDPLLDRWADEDDSEVVAFRDALTAIKPRRKLGDRALTGQVAAATIESALARFEKRGRQFADADAGPDAAHQLRIATKKLRYTVEFFAPLLPPDTQERVEALKELQTLLGIIHDRDVLIDLLAWERARALERQLHELEHAVFIDGTRDERLAAVREQLTSPDSFAATAPSMYALLIDALLERDALEGQLRARWSSPQRDTLAQQLRASIAALTHAPEAGSMLPEPQMAGVEEHDV
jgi:CHAD domain-containing protein/predicted phosphodiesterase